MSEPRPRTLTPEMRMHAAERVVADLKKNGLVDCTSATAADDIARIGQLHTDGYELAQELDRHCGWDCDLEVANVLDGFTSYATTELEAAEKAWAEKLKPAPPFPVGSKIRTRFGTGTIDGIYAYRPAKYTVIEDDEPEASVLTKRRLIVNFEDVEAA